MLAAVVLSGCCHCRQLPQIQRDTLTVTVRDSIYMHDTTLMWAVPEGGAEATADTASHLETSLAESDAAIIGGRLHHSLRNRAGELVPIKVTIPYKVHSERTEHLSERTEVVEVPADLSWWQVLWIRLGQVLSALVAVRIAIRLTLKK